jgi:hemerythrin-like domain-containing protein
MSPVPSLSARLLDDHADIETLVEDVRAAAQANVDVRTLGALWSRFARALEAHIDMEERVLFSLLEGHEPELAELAREHAWFRRELDRLTVAAELHALRDDALEAFLDRLRAHADREEATLYAFLDRELPPAKRRSLARRHDASRARDPSLCA